MFVDFSRFSLPVSFTLTTSGTTLSGMTLISLSANVSSGAKGPVTSPGIEQKRQLRSKEGPSLTETRSKDQEDRSALRKSERERKKKSGV